MLLIKLKIKQIMKCLRKNKNEKEFYFLKKKCISILYFSF